MADTQLQANYDGAIAELAAERKGYDQLKANYDGAMAELDAERKTSEAQLAGLHQDVAGLQKTASDLTAQVQQLKGGVSLDAYSVGDLVGAILRKFSHKK